MASFNLKDVGLVAVPLLLIGALVMDRRQDDHPMPLKPTRPSDDDFARPSRRRRRRVKDDFFNQKVDEDYFRADDDDEEDEDTPCEETKSESSLTVTDANGNKLALKKRTPVTYGGMTF